MMRWLALMAVVPVVTGGGPDGSGGRGGWSTTGWTSGNWSGGWGGGWQGGSSSGGDWQGGSSSGGGWNRWDEPPMPPPAGVATAGQPGEGDDVDTDEDEALWQAVDAPTAMDVDTASASAAAAPPAGVATAGRPGGSRKAEQEQRPLGTSDPNFVATWPQVRCSFCDRAELHSWKKCIRTSVYIERDGAEVRVWKYQCFHCVMAEENVSENVAKQMIMERQPNAEHRVMRQAQYNKVFQEKKMELEGVSRRCLRTAVHISLLGKLLEPITSLIIKKKKWLERRHEVMGERADLLARFKAEKDPDVQYGMLLELEEWEAKYEKDFGRGQAFSTFSEADANALLKAADYEDTWVTSAHGSIRSYYWCEATQCDQSKCDTLISSKAWDRKHKGDAEWERSGQAWYCGHCGSRYHTRFGMLIELVAKKEGVHQWLRAPIPDWDHKDLKAMICEERYSPQSAAELYRLIPMSLPNMQKDFLVPLRQCDMRDGGDPTGHFKVLGGDLLRKMPFFEWDQIFRAIGMEAPKKPEKAKKRRSGRR